MFLRRYRNVCIVIFLLFVVAYLMVNVQSGAIPSNDFVKQGQVNRVFEYEYLQSDITFFEDEYYLAYIIYNSSYDWVSWSRLFYGIMIKRSSDLVQWSKPALIIEFNDTFDIALGGKFCLETYKDNYLVLSFMSVRQVEGGEVNELIVLISFNGYVWRVYKLFSFIGDLYTFKMVKLENESFLYYISFYNETSDCYGTQILISSNGTYIEKSVFISNLVLLYGDFCQIQNGSIVSVSIRVRGLADVYFLEIISEDGINWPEYGYRIDTYNSIGYMLSIAPNLEGGYYLVFITSHYDVALLTTRDLIYYEESIILYHVPFKTSFTYIKLKYVNDKFVLITTEMQYVKIEGSTFANGTQKIFQLKDGGILLRAPEITSRFITYELSPYMIAEVPSLVFCIAIVYLSKTILSKKLVVEKWDVSMLIKLLKVLALIIFAIFMVIISVSVVQFLVLYSGYVFTSNIEREIVTYSNLGILYELTVFDVPAFVYLLILVLILYRLLFFSMSNKFPLSDFDNQLYVRFMNLIKRFGLQDKRIEILVEKSDVPKFEVITLLRKYIILISEKVLQLLKDDLEAFECAFAHELAHIKNGDAKYFSLGLATFVGGGIFYFPAIIAMVEACRSIMVTFVLWFGVSPRYVFQSILQGLYTLIITFVTFLSLLTAFYFALEWIKELSEVMADKLVLSEGYSPETLVRARRIMQFSSINMLVGISQAPKSPRLKGTGIEFEVVRILRKIFSFMRVDAVDFRKKLRFYYGRLSFSEVYRPHKVLFITGFVISSLIFSVLIISPRAMIYGLSDIISIGTLVKLFTNIYENKIDAPTLNYLAKILTTVALLSILVYKTKSYFPRSMKAFTLVLYGALIGYAIISISYIVVILIESIWSPAIILLLSIIRCILDLCFMFSLFGLIFIALIITMGISIKDHK